jgi:hypothetical protein
LGHALSFDRVNPFSHARLHPSFSHASITEREEEEEREKRRERGKVLHR